MQLRHRPLFLVPQPAPPVAAAAAGRHDVHTGGWGGRGAGEGSGLHGQLLEAGTSSSRSCPQPPTLQMEELIPAGAKGLVFDCDGTLVDSMAYHYEVRGQSQVCRLQHQAARLSS